ncbi:lysine N(6)-hydroxylase/L-ornithine N(5)-oxygenase family protein [Streptomyces sp. XM4193]|uniref:lysine N(6)-hydroxylase/L-ornithine N(5)-oxygenase family protein n=1 Tax=Streptomyces sp. XM4193 TaxID=2929782 RepID=UPI001FF847DA|nr:SidA/IucD/PvdA family monooxygenase [Streptomyces sp. XM4193]MCK1798063.1 lysine N(6)-hydroxylase/L-ornithine N(5)-oxygenase family protein [Streptomyces sp. XM4193]
MNRVRREDKTVHDVLGIGYGPSNLALAIAIEEHNRRSAPQDRLQAAFLEKQPEFGWHRGMLIDDATMQVSFLKDLVTMRDPTSDYSFLCYLKERGRLVDFLNQKTLFPLRIEFHDYFEWVAARLEHMVRYGHEVLSVEPVFDGAEVAWFDVVSRVGGPDGEQVTHRARNLCLATGLTPRIPPGAARSEQVWHTQELLPRTQAWSGPDPKRVVVLGAGQSAAEAVSYLHRSFPGAEVCAVFAKYGYTPADDSPFANRVFDPEGVDVYYRSPREVKQSLMDYHRSTNYSAVDLELIDSLYRSQYQERVQGRERLRFLNVSRIREVAPAEQETGPLRVTVEYLPTGERSVLDTDLLVYATGYHPADQDALLGRVAKLCLRDEENALRLDRDHRVAVAPNVSAGIYLQGSTEHTHGLTSTLLSHTAVRSGEILDSLLGHRTREDAAA